VKRLRKKLSSTATLGCAPHCVLDKETAQARVPVLLKAALNRLFPQPGEGATQSKLQQ
jgi:hypothetical protein